MCQLFACSFKILVWDAAFAEENGSSPLWWAAHKGRHEVIKRLMASGRDLGDLNLKGKDTVFNSSTAIEIARERHHPEVVLLLERFMADPELSRHQIRVKLGVQDEQAADLFALTVFLCDNLLQYRPVLMDVPPTAAAAAAVWFFTIARRLPMELQMILCHRVVGSPKDRVLSKDSEAAFKGLARILLSESE